jgi:hypothetical protein
MARVVVGSWMVRYPLGGNLSWTLQWLVGFRDLGHDVYLVEKSGYPDSCFDPVKGVMGDDCSYGTATVHALLARFGLESRWCFVDAGGHYHGLSRERVGEVFRSTDLFLDIGTHGSWLAEAAGARLRVLVDGEPGFTQMKMVKKRAAGQAPSEYDYYYSNGTNVGTPRSTAPTAGIAWRPLFNPVVGDLFDCLPPPTSAPFTTVMNWQAHEPFSFGGRTYGQKDVEFVRFMDLPRMTTAPLEVAVAGKVPTERLEGSGWRVRRAHEVTASFDSYRDYIRASRGEFSVCKNGYVVTNSGWFSDRSAAYLAAGRPVVLQATGFEDHLPCGRGLFAVRTPEEAAAAIDAVSAAYDRHSRWAREVAREHLEARVVLGRLLAGLNVG